MLPDAEKTSGVVNPPAADTPPKTVEPAPVLEKKPEPPAPPEPTHEIPSGYVPYQALDEERIKRKDVERRLREAEARLSSGAPSDIPDADLSEEGKILKGEIADLKAKLARKEQSDQMAVVVGKYPAIADKLDEFDEYRESRPNLTIEEAAEVFAARNKLTDKKPVRKGLESPTGGDKTGSEPGTYTAADIDRLMKTDYRKFEKLIRAGVIDPDKIK